MTSKSFQRSADMGLIGENKYCCIFIAHSQMRCIVCKPSIYQTPTAQEARGMILIKEKFIPDDDLKYLLAFTIDISSSLCWLPSLGWLMLLALLKLSLVPVYAMDSSHNNS